MTTDKNGVVLGILSMLLVIMGANLSAASKDITGGDGLAPHMVHTVYTVATNILEKE